MRERGLGAPRAQRVGPEEAPPDREWETLPHWQRYEYHLQWRRDWSFWQELPWLERQRAIHDPAFWRSLTDDQRDNFLVEADWQELRHVSCGRAIEKDNAESDTISKAATGAVELARETKLRQLVPLEEICDRHQLDHVRLYWLMSTRKLPGWLIDGKWMFDRDQISR